MYAKLCSNLSWTVWLSTVPSPAMRPFRILSLRLHPDPCRQHARFWEGSYVSAAFSSRRSAIALAKPSRGVRPLCCGDPLRRLVAKCFCLGGKGEISQKFKGKNYGVGCPGGVEAVAHSLRDVLHRHRDSDLALLKIDFKNAFNLLSREAFVKASSEMFPGLERWLGGVTINHPC